MIDTLVEEFESIDGIRLTSSKFVINSIKTNENIMRFGDNNEKMILIIHVIGETYKNSRVIKLG